MSTAHRGDAAASLTAAAAVVKALLCLVAFVALAVVLRGAYYALVGGSFQTVSGGAYAVLFGAATLVFLHWFALACSNAHELDPKACEFFPRGAVVAFILPGINLFLPLTVAKRIWLATSSAAARGFVRAEGVANIVPAESRERAIEDWCSDEVVSVWWTWSLAAVLAHAVAYATADGSLWLASRIGAELATAGAAFAAFRMVARITALQRTILSLGAA